MQFGKIDVTEGQFVVMGVMIVSSVSSFMELDIWNINVSSVVLVHRAITAIIVER